MPNDKSAAFASGQRPAPIYTRAPGHCRSVRPRCTGRSAADAGCGLRARGRPHPRDCSSGEEGPRDKAVRTRPQALSGRGSRTERAAGARGQKRSRPGKELLLNEARRPAAPRCGHAGGGTSVRANAPDFRTAAPRERRSGSPSPRTSPASARRARTGAHAPAHSHALHTHGVSGPTPVPSSRGLPAPRKGPTQFTRPQPPALAPKDPPAEARGPWGQPAARPGGPPVRGSAAPRGHSAPGPDTRQGGRGGAAPGAGTGAR